MPNKNQNNFFDDLKKIFSASIVVKNKKGNQKIVNLYKLNTNANLQTNFTYQQPNSVYRPNTGMTPSNTTSFQILRSELYSDYEVMDNDAILATALDIYADESTTRDIMGDIITIITDDVKIKDSLSTLFNNVLNIDFNLWGWVRNLVKYGDFFLKLDIVEEVGIVNAHPLSVYAVDREEIPDSPDEISFNYDMSVGVRVPFKDLRYNSNSNVATFHSYEVSHFRLLNDTNFLPYGKSILEPARKVWKQIVLMEDAMLIQRIMRAPEKRIFKVDVGSIPPAEVESHINNIMNNIKKTPLIDNKTGDYNLEFNMRNMLDDFVIPVRGGNSGTEIDTLPGLDYSAIDDIEYLRLKLLSSLKIPKAFIGFDENVGDSASLSTQDVRFSRTIERIQRIIESELTKIAITHLFAQGFSESSLVNFELRLTPSSQLARLEHLETLDQQINVANSLRDLKLFSDEYIYENIFNISSKEMKIEQNRLVNNYKLVYRLETIENDGEDPFDTVGKTDEDYNLDDEYEKKIHNVQNTYIHDSFIGHLKNQYNKKKDTKIIK